MTRKSIKATSRKRTKANAQPTYKVVNVPKQPSDEKTELAAELPIGNNAMAGGIPKWEDPLLELDPLAYIKMRRCLAVKKGVRKLSIRTQKLNWTIVGAKTSKPKPAMPEPSLGAPGIVPVKLPTKLNKLPMVEASDDVDAEVDSDAEEPESEGGEQTRAEAVAEIFGQIEGWSDFIEHCSGGLLEGTRFQQIKTLEATDERNRSKKWVVPNLYMGARHRFNAGGDIEWNGAEQIVQVEKTTGEATRKTTDLPLDQFAIHRPGPGSNPEGDLDLGVAVFNAVVLPWGRGITSGDLWVRLFAVPAILAGTKLDNARPDRITTMLQQRAQQIQNLMQTQGSTAGLSNDEMIRLLQADPGGLTGIVAWQQYLESLVDDVLTLAALTSSAGVAQASRTGNTAEQKDNEDEAAFANGVQIAETFNRHILPWILKRNEATLPELEEGESEVYLWPNDPNEGDEQDIDVETEGTPGMDPEAEDVEKSAMMFADLQAKAFHNRSNRASVALAAFQPLPPVHP